jgi:hypothetical protein
MDEVTPVLLAYARTHYPSLSSVVAAIQEMVGSNRLWPEHVRIDFLAIRSGTTYHKAFAPTLFLYGNGCPPHLIYRYLELRCGEDVARYRQFNAVLRSCQSSKAAVWSYFDLTANRRLYMNGSPAPLQ